MVVTDACTKYMKISITGLGQDPNNSENRNHCFIFGFFFGSVEYMYLLKIWMRYHFHRQERCKGFIKD